MSENFPAHARPYICNLSKPKWTIYDNSIINYFDDFAQLDADRCLPSVLEYLKAQPVPVILDLQSSTAALSSLHEKILINKPRIKAMAVGLEQEKEPNKKALNELLGIQALAGNLHSTHTWKQISNWLGEDKVHLIMERGYGGLHYIPNTLHYYRKAAGWLWNMLDPNGGVMLMQVPPFNVLEKRGIPINYWLGELQTAGIYHQALPIADWGHDAIDYGFLMLRKNPEAPVLPDIVRG
jgi:hypothetical protein